MLKHHHPLKSMVSYLERRHIAFALKQEVLTYPSSVFYLAALGKKVHSRTYHAVYRTRAIEDIRWTIGRYGSLDRVRIFIARPEAAQQIADTLSRDKAQIDYDRLLDLAEYHTLFDDDWEYFFVLTRKPYVNHMLSWLRRACHGLGVETETSTEARRIANLRGRLERLTGLALFRPLAAKPST